MAKKIIAIFIDVISVIMIVAAVAILATVVFTKSGQAPSILGHSAFRVLTGSMEPTISVDSMVITEEVAPEDVKVGDVITFYSADPDLDGSVVTHRVSQIDNSGSDLVFTTKGDMNVIEDEYPVTRENLIGRVVFTSILMGKIVRLSANPLIFILLIMIPLAIFLVVNVVNTVQKAKEIEKEELEELMEGKKKTEEEQLRAEIDRIKEEIKAQEQQAEGQDKPVQSGSEE